MKKQPLSRQPLIAPLVIIEILIGIALAGLAFLLFFALSHRVLTEPFLVFDHEIMTSIYRFRSPGLTQLMLLLTALGSTSVLLSASVLLFSFLLIKKYRYEAVLFSLTFAIGFFLSLLFKGIIARARPDVAPLIHELFYSFPSGHSMNAFVFYALLAYFTYHFTRQRGLTFVVVLLCSLVIAAVGLSRIYLGVHYPSDVFAGFLAGLGWFLTVLVIDRTLQAYRSYQRNPRT